MPATVLIGIIPPMLGAIFFASHRADMRLHQDAQENIASQAQMLANTVSWWNQMNVLSLNYLARHSSILAMEPGQQKPVLQNLVNTNERIYLAATVNSDGWTMARNDSRKSVYYGDRSWFLGALAGKEISYQALISRTLLQPAVCMATPIQQQSSANTEKILGVATICTELSDLAEQIGQLQFGDTGYALLVDQTGKLLAHPNSALISGTQLQNLNQYPPIRNVLEGRSGFYAYQNDKQIDWVSYGITLDNGWRLAIVQQESEFLKTETDFKKLTYLIAIISAIAVSIFTWILASHLIRPIGKLTTAAMGISDGRLDKTVEIQRRDELGILAQSFNQMATRLKSSFEELENRVKQRTVELNTAKEAAESANHTKDRFLARISHELRSPLNTIISYAAILQEQHNLDDGQLKGLNAIKASGVHLLNLIEDILDFSKAKVSKIQLNPSYIEWQSFLDGIVGMMEVSAQEKQLLFECETVGDLGSEIWADEKRLRQVLINLLNNAIKFTYQGQVTLRVSVLTLTEALAPAGSVNPYADSVLAFGSSPTQQVLRFEVIDTGVGISSEHLMKIFQPFEQVGVTEQQTSGAGLGLAISQQIVEMMGSQLRVKSELGTGSTFWFDLSLPVVKVIPKITGQITGNSTLKPLSPTRTSLGQKILIVDDKEENHLALNVILKPLGFELFTAVNGLQALEIAPLTKPDLILLDLYMPVKTGFTLVRELRKMPEFASTPIILISSSSHTIVERVSQNLGCEGFLTKPIDEEKLLSLLKRHGMLL